MVVSSYNSPCSCVASFCSLPFISLIDNVVDSMMANLLIYWVSCKGKAQT
jgi:hypothetical protein